MKRPIIVRHTKKMKVVEKFISINGEGTKAGELAVFIRFKGCNLNCSYCDTSWANDEDCPYEEMSPHDILFYILSTDIDNVTLTGGEPLLQRDMGQLLTLLSDYPGINVEIETNGAVDIAPFCKFENVSFTMDYKLQSSGCEGYMLLSNFKHLKPADTIKFVVGSRKELEYAHEIILLFHLTSRCHVYLSPVFGSVEPSEIVDYMKEQLMNNVRIQLQMHKFIWDPTKRGV